MAYFDVDDPIRKQLAEKYESSGKGPTITVDAVTGETSLGAKKNPTAKDWRDSYENYMKQGGSPLTAPAGTSATRMYQHAIFKGRGMSYYSSEPFESTGFLGEIQQDITPEIEDEGVVSDSTPTPYIPKIGSTYSQVEQEENPYDVIPDLGYATGYGTTLAGMEVDITEINSTKNLNNRSLFDRGFSSVGMVISAFAMLFGDHPSIAESNKMLDKLKADDPHVFTPPTRPNFTTGVYDPSKPWGDIEGGATTGLPGGLPGSTTGWDAWANAVNDAPTSAPSSGYSGGSTTGWDAETNLSAEDWAKGMQTDVTSGWGVGDNGEDTPGDDGGVDATGTSDDGSDDTGPA